MLFVALLMLLASVVIAVSYSSPSNFSESCRTATLDHCVDFGRTASAALFLLALCLVLGALQVCRIVNTAQVRKGIHWRSFLWATRINDNLNPTVTRFAMATSLIAAPLIAIYLGWMYVFAPKIDPGLPAWSRDGTAAVIASAAVWMFVEYLANWKTINAEIGDWKRGALSVFTLALLECIKNWAGWSWSEIAALTGSVAVAITFWRWALSGSNAEASQDSRSQDL